mgnify:CR=1 FL=1
MLGAGGSGAVHFGLEAVSGWLQSGEAGRTRLGASYAAGAGGARLLVVAPDAFPLLLEAVDGLGAKVDAALAELDALRASAARAAMQSVELDEMRRQCRAASWHRHGAPIEDTIDLMRVFNRPAIPTWRDPAFV